MRKWLALVVPVVLLVTAGSRLVADGAANLAYLDLLPHLAEVLPTFELPDCEDRADVSAARRLLAWGIAWDPAQRQEMLLGWTAWFEGRCSEAKVGWDQACIRETSPQGTVSCLQIALVTQGEMGGVPPSDSSSGLLSRYADQFGRWAERVDVNEAAEFGYQLSLELGPNYHAAERLAGFLRQERRQQQAVMIWDQMAADLPLGDADHWLFLGHAAELERDWQRAASAYGHGAQLAKEPFGLWIKQGRAFGHLRDWARAREAYARAFLERPLHPVPSRDLGSIYLLQEKHAEAGRWIWLALQLEPNGALSHYYMAQVLYGEGEEDEAVIFLAQAVALHSGRPWRWLVELGDWQLALDDRTSALEAYRQALVWQPGEASIEERIEQVMEN